MRGSAGRKKTAVTNVMVGFTMTQVDEVDLCRFIALNVTSNYVYLLS